MNLSDFDYYLPEHLIAQTPLERRDCSRLLVMDRHSGNIEHRHFYDIADYLCAGDVLVLNDSKVIPARIYGKRMGSGGVVETLLLKAVAENKWEALVKPGRKALAGQVIEYGQTLVGTVESVKDDGNRIIKFTYDGKNIYEILDEIGNMPIPPYIKERLTDKNRYQTVYAKHLGSAAAPTAGLHFTKELLEKLKKKGVIIKYVTLHVGLGTFRPVKTSDITKHIMHSEHYFVPQDTEEAIIAAKAQGRRVICVGTTSVRTVESAFSKDIQLISRSDDTNIFIYPGYEFKVVDALITNFHLPQSTLMMLVSAFSSRDMIMNAYSEAIAEEYRFFSFGDAMFIV
ncbi:MAG: tRNA preQ1(34) S-adenosylmethionine ribosyltransferase-isomerase QueA [Clostridia bacterium]|nr:tRNA preQ1(34) S-adenosylmethionine ribosyltransferase-isomerase QueA [Clostridia bacterium]